MSSITIENLSKTFAVGRRLRHVLWPKGAGGLRRVEALKKIFFTIPAGKFYGLMGPNGSGKTTLLKILAAQIIPDEGRVFLNGSALTNESHVKRSVGMVSGDERSFYWRLTGMQNLEFFAALYKIPSKIAKQRIARLCEQLEIENPDRFFREYSTGLKQRFALARALLHDPAILLLDEPTKGLDQKSAAQFREFVSGLSRREGKTILYATHSEEEASTLFERIALLRKGVLLREGIWKEIKGEYLC